MPHLIRRSPLSFGYELAGQKIQSEIYGRISEAISTVRFALSRVARFSLRIEPSSSILLDAASLSSRRVWRFIIKRQHCIRSVRGWAWTGLKLTPNERIDMGQPNTTWAFDAWRIKEYGTIAAKRAEIQGVVVSRKAISRSERRTRYYDKRTHAISCYQSCDWCAECYEILFHER